MSQIQALLGRPSRTKINSAQEAADKQRRFGAVPNDIYTYDANGILVYQKPGSTYIESISVNFENEGFDFSPSRNFNGTLSIAGRQISNSTTSQELQALAGMRLSPSTIKKYSAKYGIHDLFFDFGTPSGSKALTGVSIELGQPQKVNAKGWTESDIRMMRATVLQAPQMKQLATQYNFSIAAFADCYTEKLSTQITKEQLQALNSQAQSKVQSIMEGCVLEVAKR
ncbi:hypothetical protein J7E24_10025 [Hymenobacter sp. ISL-91]|uniref:DUF7738 domain-containing protein n=1 Tax=Hymenobacter sp. ISL-91 TaxID=2819151 RepID=UPI001BEC035D|nr:hypothetical protein [Hymenobacter sp. ISL-91]MBT2558122.1 hypothetical protein [Hymenobacter sp. ISL-91]